MYLVYLDGQLLYSTDMADEATVIEAPKLSLEVNKSGTFEFTIHPTHYLYDYIHKMRSIVQVLWDDVEVFYGRVLETEVSMYKEKKVTCESALAFLNDTVQPPLGKNAKFTVTDLVTQILSNHNSQIDDASKHFEIGEITIGGDTQYPFERTSYQDSRSSIEDIMKLLDGYLRVRRVNGVLYLDMLDDYDKTVNQSVEFGVNLADITVNDEAEDLFTAVWPVGKNNLVIPENQGGPYLEDENLVALYGRIIRVVSFDNVTKVPDLIQNGTEYLQKNGANIPTRYEVKAVDLHYFDPEKDLLLPGYTIPILSSIHGIDEDQLVCISCELDIQNPENNSYTIGIPDPFDGSGSKGYSNGSTSMTTAVARSTKSTGAEVTDLKQKYGDVEVEADSLRAEIGTIKVRTDSLEITTGNLDSKTDGMQASIAMNASQISTLVTDNQSIHTEIIQTNHKIELKADSDTVNNGLNALSTRITQTASQIELKADKTYTDNEVSKLSTRITQNAGAITLKAEKSYVDSNVETLSSQITVNADNINLKVSKGEVISAINASPEGVTISGDKVDLTANTEFNLKVGKGDIASSINATAQSVKISASKINLSGYVTADDLSATNAKISRLMAGNETATYIRTSSLAAPYATINTLEVNDSLTISPTAFSLGGSTVQLRNKQFVTNITTRLVTFTDMSGNQIQFYAIGSFDREWVRYAGT